MSSLFEFSDEDLFTGSSDGSLVSMLFISCPNCGNYGKFGYDENNKLIVICRNKDCKRFKQKIN